MFQHTDFNREEALSLYLSGETYAAVAKRYGVSTGLIQKIAKAAGVQGKGGRTALLGPVREKAVEMWRRGDRVAEIARSRGLQ